MTLNLFEAYTDLQKLLIERINKLTAEWTEKREKAASLNQEAGNLSDDISRLEKALEVEGRLSGQVIEKPALNGAGRFIGQGLREVVSTLRKETPDITKADISKYLQGIGFNFKGKRPGNAVHMAWISQDRDAKIKENGDRA